MTRQMLPLESLPRPVWSMARKVGMLTIRSYLVIALLLVVVKVVQLALCHDSPYNPTRGLYWMASAR